MPDVTLAYRPFAAQVAAFRQRVTIPSERWDDLMHGDHAHGFMVAGLARADVLQDLRGAIEAAANDGETLADFRQRFETAVANRWTGWTGEDTPAGRAWRTRVIYRTNLRTTYMSGRWETLQNFPALKYQHNSTKNPREEHQAWDGLIIATDDTWWSTNYPPNGWGCACTVTGVSQQRMRALGRSLDQAPATVAGDPPPEWAYHVGRSSRSLSAASALAERVADMPPAWRAQVLADAASRPEIFAREWASTITGVLASDAPRGAAVPLGWLSPSAQAVRPGSPLIAGVDRLAVTARTDAATVVPVLRDLPRRLQDPATLVLQQGQQTAYAIPLPDERWLVLPLRAKATGQGKGISAQWIARHRVMTQAEIDAAGWLRVGQGGS